MKTKRTIKKEIIEISGKYNEEEGLEEFNTARTYWRQEVQRETSSNLFNEFVWMDGRAKIKSDGKHCLELQETGSWAGPWSSTFWEIMTKMRAFYFFEKFNHTNK